MIVLAAALALQPPLVAPPPYPVGTDTPAPETVAVDLATGVSLIKGTCWDHLRDPLRLQAEAERAGFNFFRLGSRPERRIGTGPGTLNYSDGPVHPRGPIRQCDIFMRIIATLTAALQLPAAEPSPAPAGPSWVPPTRDTNWNVPNPDGTSLRVRLVSSQARRGGNVHFYVTLDQVPPPKRGRSGK